MGSQVGAQSGVSKSVPAGQVVWGYPAAPIKQAKEQMARFAMLPRLFERVKRLEQDAREKGKTSPTAM